jgi:integrase
MSSIPNDKRKRTILLAEDVLRLLAASPCVFMLASILTGMRPGEMASLTWADVDWFSEGDAA